MIVKKVLENLGYVVVVFLLFLWFGSKNQMSNFSFDTSNKGFDYIVQGYDFSSIGDIKKLEYSIDNCSDISPVSISYPKYWMGYNSLVNGEEISLIGMGEYPSVEQYLFSNSLGYSSELQPTIIQVNGTTNPRFSASVKNCFLIQNDEKYFTCTPWIKFTTNSINRKNFVTTSCVINVCGKEEEIKCLFEDYMPDLHDSFLSRDSFCIAEDSEFCNKDSFLKYIYSLY